MHAKKYKSWKTYFETLSRSVDHAVLEMSLAQSLMSILLCEVIGLLSLFFMWTIDVKSYITVIKVGEKISDNLLFIAACIYPVRRLMKD